MKKNTGSAKNGSALVMTLVLLVTACLIIGALSSLAVTNSRNLRTATARERAFYLADSGLRCAMNQMLDDRSGVISKNSSRGFFSDTSMFGNGDWGFSTSIENISGRTNRLVSVGTFNGVEQRAEVVCVDVSEDQILNFIYRLVIYSGAPGGLIQVGGFGDLADFVNGDVYGRGSIEVLGDARLRFGEMDDNGNGILEPDELWEDAYAVASLGPMTQEEFDTYCGSVSAYTDLFYGNGQYDPGEAFVDNIGNGVYDENEEFTDLNGDGVYNPGDTIIDNGNGAWDPGETWVDDPDRYGRDNGRYDPAGGYYNSSGNWRTGYWVREGWHWEYYSCANWPAEAFEDQGDEIYVPGEPFVDCNGVYDEGEVYLDDRNGSFDWGTMASGVITGMGAGNPDLGLRDAWGGDPVIDPPDLNAMYYSWSKSGPTPPFADANWGHDIEVNSSDYSANGMSILDDDDPEHVFIRNPSTSQNRTYGGVTIRSRSYTPIYYDDGEGNPVRVDDYFLEDPTDSSYNNPDSGGEIGDAGSHTYPMYLDVKENGNEKVYYVNGNLYLHSPVAYALRFKEPGTKITIVAKGNITISDEFYYNADYDEDLEYNDIDSTIVNNPEDMLCLVALKNPSVPDNSGNIYIGDSQFGTGGSIHAMMYAENDFVDNNIGGSGQSFISIYGNMTAGGELAIQRDPGNWTRLDVSLDRRLSLGLAEAPGLPSAPSGSVFMGSDGNPEWEIVEGTWQSASLISQ